MNTMMIKYLLVILPLIVMVGCARSNPAIQEKESTDYFIYSTFCNYFADRLSEKKVTTIVFSKETEIDTTMMKMRENKEISRILDFFPALHADTLHNLFQENVNRSDLKNSIKRDKKIIFLSKEERKSIFDSENWDKFHMLYDGAYGIMNLSKIGYSNDQKQAVLFYNHFCGMKCGSGGFVLFRLLEGKWQLEIIFPLFIS